MVWDFPHLAYSVNISEGEGLHSRSQDWILYTHNGLGYQTMKVKITMWAWGWDSLSPRYTGFGVLRYQAEEQCCFLFQETQNT